MFKQKLTFSETYSEFSNNSGFDPIEEQGVKIIERTIEIEPSSWHHGSCLIFRCFQKEFNIDMEVFTGLNTVLVREIWVYDNPFSEEYIIPNSEQKRLIQALASHDLRGDYAASIINDLFVDFMIINQKENFKDLLPNHYEFLKDLYEKSNWEFKSKST